MCDTMVALGNSTKEGSVIFGKNSDRQPNEPHLMIRIPRRRYKAGEKLKCTYIEIEQVEETYEVLLLKPSWIWGCEMGCNEFGLNIGNEAVFTREKYDKAGLLGMDMLRIALERCKTSLEALHMITGLLQKYGQGGNCGYQKKFIYHNSFLIADKESAWVLETAGEYWAAEKVKDVRSISNYLTIGDEFDLCHPDLIKHAVDKGWCKNEQDFNFALCYSDPLLTKLSGALDRHRMSTGMLQREKGNITVETIKTILRCHREKDEGKEFSKSSLKSICMHGGFIYGDHTTGSYVASLNDKLSTYFVTGASTPCISTFKPLWLIEGEPLTFSEDEQHEALKYWIKREKLHRLIVEGKIPDLKSYRVKRYRLEAEFKQMIDSLDIDDIQDKNLIEIMNYAKEKEEELVSSTIDSILNRPSNISGGLYYKHYWKKQNESLES